MKLIISILFIALLGFTHSHAQTCHIDVTINEFSKDTIILGYYFNKQMFVEDTIPSVSSGKFIIEKKEPLKQGMYIIYLNSDQYFDVLIGEDQTFSITTSADDLISNTEIKGSKESSSFLEYQKLLSKLKVEAKDIQEQIKNTEDEALKTNLTKKLQGFGDEIKQKSSSLINENQGSFLAIFLKGLQEVEVPEMTAPENSENPEQEVQRMRFNYYKQHYFENLNLSDERLLRTPYFTDKIDRYLSQVLVIPDTIIVGCHKMIAAAEGNDEMEKYLIQHLFNWANDSKTMGMDAVMVDMADAYYLNGRADWVDEEFLTKLQERVDKIKPTLLNKVAKDFKMQSYTGEYHRLSEVRAPITILVFWEPECGHCKKEIPKLNEEVWKNYADKGIKIVAVYTQHNKEDWEAFITDHALEEWIHLYDPYNQSGFRNNYDIYSTPVIYILDKDKKILAKRLGVEQIPGFLDHQLKNL